MSFALVFESLGRWTKCFYVSMDKFGMGYQYLIKFWDWFITEVPVAFILVPPPRDGDQFQQIIDFYHHRTLI